jgi:hypothetical protein
MIFATLQKRIFSIFLLLTLTFYSCSTDKDEPIAPEVEMTEEEMEVVDEAANTEDSTEDTTEDTTEDSTEDTTEDSTENTTEDSTEDSTEETTEDSTEDSTEDTTDDSTDDNTDDSTDDNTDDSTDDNTDDSTDTNSCTNPADFVFQEEDGLVLAEFEDVALNGAWALRTEFGGFSGDGYLVWEGPQYFNQPGNGILTFKINIQTPGTYRFMWHTDITIGDSGSEHNDTWLRFDDADDFFGVKVGGTGIVYPRDRGKSPNPQGSSSDGWFKVFRSGNLDYQWEAFTSDNNAHDIYVTFNNPGIYTMEVSARSSGHAIDRFVLFTDNWSPADATGSSNFSTITCD